MANADVSSLFPPLSSFPEEKPYAGYLIAVPGFTMSFYSCVGWTNSLLNI